MRCAAGLRRGSERLSWSSVSSVQRVAFFRPWMVPIENLAHFGPCQPARSMGYQGFFNERSF